MSEAAWSQEYDARFVSWEGAVFRRILDAIAEPPTNVPAVAIGVDWGRSNDYTVYGNLGFVAVELAWKVGASISLHDTRDAH